jgi:hypothetical protein
VTAPPEKLLAIYLNDHLAGATVGVELVRRVRGTAAGDEEGAIARLCAEIEADKATLEQVMEELGVERERLKPAAGWLAEELGRLKPNGQLRGSSPLSRVVEMEGLYLGVTGKMQLWKTLERTVGGRLPGVDFAQLAERAAAQREAIDALHREASREALPTSP